jgi:hypothetical protein
VGGTGALGGRYWCTGWAVLVHWVGGTGALPMSSCLLQAVGLACMWGWPACGAGLHVGLACMRLCQEQLSREHAKLQMTAAAAASCRATRAQLECSSQAVVVRNSTMCAAAAYGAGASTCA